MIARKRLMSALLAAFLVCAQVAPAALALEPEENQQIIGTEGEGEKPEGENPEGEKPEGENPEGENPEGENPEGENPEGEKPEGEKPEGEKPEGEKPEGEKPGGEKPEGGNGLVQVPAQPMITVVDGDISWYEPEKKEFTLNTEEQLRGLSALANGKAGLETALDFADCTITLGENITLTKPWAPIGLESTPFAGTLDGGNFTISGLAVESEEQYNGFFAFTNGATLRNLTLDGSVKGQAYVGGLIGHAKGTQVENCVNKAAVTSTFGSVGGIVGYGNGGSIINCENQGAITVETDDAMTGGIIGEASFINLERCTNSGSVKSKGDNVGGIAGTLTCAESTVVTRGKNTGAVKGYSNVGGIVGQLQPFKGDGTKTIRVQSCLNTGKVEGSSKIGLILGSNNANWADCVSLDSLEKGDSVNGHLVSAVAMKWGRAVWLLNGGQPGYWQQGTEGPQWGEKEMTIHRVTIKYLSPVTVTISLDGTPLGADSCFVEEGENAYYLGAGQLKLQGDGLICQDAVAQDDGSYLFTVKAGLEITCGTAGDFAELEAEKKLIAWYLGNEQESSFTLKKLEEFQGFQMLVNGKSKVVGKPVDFSRKTINLAADLDLAGLEWAPIGTVGAPFAGTFDGKGYSIANLAVTQPDGENCGLFGVATGTIRNLKVTGSVTGKNNAGGILGNGDNSAKMSNCQFAGTVSGKESVGGILGNGATSMSRCSSSGAVQGDAFVGGLAGTGGAISFCHSISQVTGTAQVGGLAGKARSIIRSFYYNAETPLGVAGEYSGTGEPTTAFYLAETPIAGALGKSRTAEQFKGKQIVYELSNSQGYWGLGELYPQLLEEDADPVVFRFAVEPKGEQGGKVTLEDGVTTEAYLLEGETITLLVQEPEGLTVVFSPDNVVQKSEDKYTVTMARRNISLTYEFVQWQAADTSWYSAEESSFTLTTEAQLRGLGVLVNGGEGFAEKTIALGQDIVCSPTAQQWEPIGTKDHPFQGNFQGNGHKITGYFMENSRENMGLFGVVQGASFHNVTVEGRVTGGKYTGGLVGKATDSTFNACNTTQDHRVVGKGDYTGGLLGWGEGITLEECSNASVVTSGSYCDFTAGLAAYLGTDSKVQSCKNTGNITGENWAAGLVGYAQEGSGFVECENSGAIVAKGNGGGIVGMLGPNGSLENCENQGTVTGQAGVYVSDEIINDGFDVGGLGGILGYGRPGATLVDCRNSGDISQCKRIGGIAGMLNRVKTLTGCQNTGNVKVTNAGSANPIVGGLVGHLASRTNNDGVNNMAFSSLVEYCRNEGSVGNEYMSTSTTNNYGTGGLFGVMDRVYTRSTTGLCANTGDVTAAGNRVGGLVGCMMGSSFLGGASLADCYNSGSVQGNSFVGGLVGYDNGDGSNVTNSFSIAPSVTGKFNVGPVFGQAGKAFNCYYLDVLGPNLIADGSKAKTTQEFMNDSVNELLDSSLTGPRGIWAQGPQYPEFKKDLQKITYRFGLENTTPQWGSMSFGLGRSLHFGRFEAGQKVQILLTPQENYAVKSYKVTEAETGIPVTAEVSEKDGVVVLSLEMAPRPLQATATFGPKATGKFNVTFQANGGQWASGETEKTIEVRADQRVEAPEEPTHATLDFLGWFEDEACTLAYDWSSGVQQDFTLYAGWGKKLQITLDPNGGRWLPESDGLCSVVAGQVLARPQKAPLRQGYQFAGWFVDQTCLEPYGFGQPVNEPLHLYAAWAPEGKARLVLYANGGSWAGGTEVREELVPLESTLSQLDWADLQAPAAQTLRGWYTQHENGTAWKPDAPIAQSMVLYAHWQGSQVVVNPGSPGAPTTVDGVDQLESLQKLINSGGGGDKTYYINLEENITLPENWQPIGTQANPFSVVMDGGGATLAVANQGNPLFGHLENSEISNFKVVGGTIDKAGLVAVMNGGSLVGCTLESGTRVRADARGRGADMYFSAGGLLGNGTDVAIENCVVKAGVTVSGGSSIHVGGLVGTMEQGSLTNCSSGADVVGSTCAGGLVGNAWQHETGDVTVISGCFSSGRIDGGQSGAAGGILGSQHTDGTGPQQAQIIDCYSTATVTGKWAGGIWGSNNTIDEKLKEGEPLVQNCWWNGEKVEGETYTGGLIGRLTNLPDTHQMKNNYFAGPETLAGLGSPSDIDTQGFIDKISKEAIASGQLAYLLDGAEKKEHRGVWTQSGAQPALGAGTVRRADLQSPEGKGTASLAGIAQGQQVYQTSGQQIRLNPVPDSAVETVVDDQGNTSRVSWQLEKALVTYTDGQEQDITESLAFTVRANADAKVSVLFAQKTETTPPQEPDEGDEGQGGGQQGGTGSGKGEEGQGPGQGQTPGTPEGSGDQGSTGETPQGGDLSTGGTGDLPQWDARPPAQGTLEQLGNIKPAGDQQPSGEQGGQVAEPQPQPKPKPEEPKPEVKPQPEAKPAEKPKTFEIARQAAKANPLAVAVLTLAGAGLLAGGGFAQVRKFRRKNK